MDNIKPVNDNERAELSEIQNKVRTLRYEVGVAREQRAEIEANEQQLLVQIQQAKNAFRDRVLMIAKSQGIVLTDTKENKAWMFDEASLSFFTSVKQTTDETKTVD